MVDVRGPRIALFRPVNEDRVRVANSFVLNTKAMTPGARLSSRDSYRDPSCDASIAAT